MAEIQKMWTFVCSLSRIVAAGIGVAACLGLAHCSKSQGDPAAPSATQPATTSPSGSTTQPSPASRVPSPSPPGARAYRAERNRMVDQQIAGHGVWRTGVTDKRVLQAMRTVPRHVFVPQEMVRHAYEDTPLPIGHGQTISQPYIVAFMTERLELKPDARVLEIGTGSGYQAAVLAQLTPHVYTIEIIKPLAARAQRALAQQGYRKVHRRRADGYFGWPEAAPFDAIIVTCAAGHLPPPLWEQVKPGGHIVIPIGGPYESQRLVVVTKRLDGRRESKSVMGVRFVPLTREK